MEHRSRPHAGGILIHQFSPRLWAGVLLVNQVRFTKGKTMDWETWCAETRDAIASLRSGRDIEQLDDLRNRLAAYAENWRNVPQDVRTKAKWIATDGARLYREACEELAKGPGKFEAEPGYVIPFYDAVMNGFDDNGRVDVEPVDRFIWPDLKRRRSVLATEDDNGFVYVR